MLANSVQIPRIEQKSIHDYPLILNNNLIAEIIVVIRTLTSSATLINLLDQILKLKIKNEI